MIRTLFVASVLLLAACKKEEATPAPAPSAAPPPAKIENPVQDPSVDNEYLIGITAAPPYLAGKEAVATISVTARKGFHVNPEYPMSFKPTPTEGVKYGAERVQLTVATRTPCKEKAEDNCAVDVNLPVTPEKAGVAVIEGVLSFSVCSDEKCLTPKQTVSLAVDVQ